MGLVLHEDGTWEWEAVALAFWGYFSNYANCHSAFGLLFPHTQSPVLNRWFLAVLCEAPEF